MKRSSLIISLLVVVTFTFCHSRSRTKKQSPEGEVSSTTNNSGNQQSTDTIQNKHNKAIIHNAPDQARIDSIKKAKTAEKNKK